MGFLSGAYGKLMAGKLVRDIQYQMTSVQSRLRRVTREIGQKEKMYQTQERNMKNQMQNQMRMCIFGALQGSDDPALQQYGQLMMSGGDGIMGAYAAGYQLDTSASSKYSMIQSAAQMQFTQYQTLWQNMFEMQREADLQALKDLEEDLQTEKDNLESRLQIAKAEYDAKKEEEKDGAKNLAPNYTGQ